MEPRAAFLVGCARSGTTLVRRIVDAHPEIAAPAEANIPALIDQAGHTWRTVWGGHHELRLGHLPDDIRAEIRSAAMRPMAACCRGTGATVYCDKSLGALDCLPAVADVLPDARYVLVFRQVMDVVASALEASPWGFRGYGFLPFVERSMDNFVAGLVDYWTAHVSAALQWEASQPAACHRVRYEDLVTSPVECAAGLFAFLGVPDEPAALERAFDATGAGVLGDHKINYTDAIHAESVGRGRKVPVALIPPPVAQVANACLAELGYPTLTAAWNTEAAIAGANGAGEVTASARRTERALAAEMGRLRVRRPHSAPGVRFAVRIDDRPGLGWLIDLADGAVVEGGTDGDFAIVACARDLLAIIVGDENVGTLLRSGRLRYAGPMPEGHEVEHVREAVRALRSAQ
jgi:hypothetical protein